MRASRWNGKIDHVSRLNNISETTAESRGSRGLCLLDFFHRLHRASRAKSELLYRVCTKRKKARGKRREMRNMGKGGGGDGKTRGEKMRTDGQIDRMFRWKKGLLKECSCVVPTRACSLNFPPSH